MDTTIVLFIINGLLGVIMLFMGHGISSNKDKFRDMQQQQNDMRDRAMLKEDFREFKQELWERLDQLLKRRSN